jgi:RNA-directed DNA polymerase
MPSGTRKNERVERYNLEQSPFAQNPTQRDVAALVGETRDDLRRLINYKDRFIIRRQAATGKKGKLRNLAYPVGRLRAVHERFKFHLNKIKQPSYLFSPRRNRGQRDNAALHLDQHQYLSLDLKQFYPSTNDHMVRRWFIGQLGMYQDVAGQLTHLCTVDGKVSFGSPLTPVLCSLIHRPMFDLIAEICHKRNLRYSVWVDDLTISGRFVPREVLNEIRAIVRGFGLKSHKVEYRCGNRPVFVTGIGVVGPNLVAPNALHLRLQAQWTDYHMATANDERHLTCQRLLSSLGTLRHIVGPSSEAGRKASDQMNSLRQRKDKSQRAFECGLRKITDFSIFVTSDASTPPPF